LADVAQRDRDVRPRPAELHVDLARIRNVRVTAWEVETNAWRVCRDEGIVRIERTVRRDIDQQRAV